MFVAAFGSSPAVARASTLTVKGACLDDDVRISKNGVVVYDGTRITDCNPDLIVNIDASCSDYIKLDFRVCCFVVHPALPPEICDAG